ncbi:MAG: porin [Rhodocyclaceae bacterium]|nr:porin [Rhodocyclaceae bacterium]
MQKKIIALAIAGLASSAAFAQTNVTVYGKIDMSYEHSSGTGGSKTTGINSGGHDGSRLGFRGEEALGGGMKAILAWNTAHWPLIATLVLLAHVSLSSVYPAAFGTIKAGNIYATGANWAGKYDSLDAANSYSPLQYFNGNFGATINPYATQNSVGYTSPSMSGFTAPRRWWWFAVGETRYSRVSLWNKSVCRALALITTWVRCRLVLFITG